MSLEGDVRFCFLGGSVIVLTLPRLTLSAFSPALAWKIGDVVNENFGGVDNGDMLNAVLCSRALLVVGVIDD